MTTILQSVTAYETWMRAQLGADLVEGGLAKKHKLMKGDSFSFLRGTYWRWAETILDIYPDLKNAPQLLAIGDTHLENFGTWRDDEGRLVWGANDFDEAAVMPYALDLVRLAVSAIMAGGQDGPTPRIVADSILAGYRRGLRQPSPVVLERDYKWLRNAVLLPNAERKAFWEKYRSLPPATDPVADRYLKALHKALPDPVTAFEPKPRLAGTGSLGRPRFVAYIDWRGGPVLREVKALLQSGWSLKHDPSDKTIRTGIIAGGRARSPDPRYQVAGTLLVRRLSPNSRKIEVDGDAQVLLSPDMLDLMGFEIANCHANDASLIPGILADLDARRSDWLRAAAKAATVAVSAEQAEFARKG
ncbi:DUF2252 family protein [Rhizobium sp. P40RR-XXII]|uniref:DUF2252 family protein n=1 Tax=unclassified Rhizobium TaxID=2613769 RepID=UPI00145795A1|nr:MULTISPECIES: DUF2252 family protein [unclassified Rhizobium]NLR87716.1 DUF2252 family protein [Rhizobium sp. P28RR-XV]NLS18376.1 DUF2252 family protein [Rhizobium sp. P40RR-XXII]